jgi:hypothetical protein|eukprot:COSAG01_NODE_4077_length_5379_cov_16.101894_2_plen_194_part_00
MGPHRVWHGLGGTLRVVHAAHCPGCVAGSGPTFLGSLTGSVVADGLLGTPCPAATTRFSHFASWRRRTSSQRLLACARIQACCPAGGRSTNVRGCIASTNDLVCVAVSRVKLGRASHPPRHRPPHSSSSSSSSSNSSSSTRTAKEAEHRSVPRRCRPLQPWRARHPSTRPSILGSAGVSGRTRCLIVPGAAHA